MLQYLCSLIILLYQELYVVGDHTQKSIDKYDQAMREYAREWMKSLDRPRYSTNIGTFFVIIFLFIWASTLTSQLGYTPRQGFGIFVFIIIGVALGFGSYIFNYLLSLIGFPKPVRSAIWFSVLIGPYLGIVAINNLKNPILSHIIGVASGVIAFVLSYGLDIMFERRINPTR